MLSILVGAIVLFVFGAVWFTFIMGKTWARLMEFTPEASARMKEKGMALPMVFNFLLQVLFAAAVYYLYPQILVLSLPDFIRTMLIIWLGFSFPIYANSYLWEGKSWKLVLINSASGVISVILISMVIYWMK